MRNDIYDFFGLFNIHFDEIKIKISFDESLMLIIQHVNLEIEIDWEYCENFSSNVKANLC